MFGVIGSIVYENYPVHYVSTNARREKYYVQGVDDLPAKYFNYVDAFYVWKKHKNKIILFDKDTNVPILRNFSQANKPTMETINGSKLHTCKLPDHQRAKIMDTLHPYFAKQLPPPFPLIEGRVSVMLNFHIDPSEIKDGDIDNHQAFYTKAFMDAVTKSKWWEDDKLQFVKGFWANHEYAKIGERKLVIHFLNVPENVSFPVS